MENKLNSKQDKALEEFLKTASKAQEHFIKKGGKVDANDKEWNEHLKRMTEELDKCDKEFEDE